MLPIEQLTSPGEHGFVFQGVVGQLEAILTVPDAITSQTIALLGHPHSLQGGTMNNKVVTTMARAFRDAGIPSVRFNFRGVGNSEGQYDEGIGESKDMLQLMTLWKERQPDSEFVFAGFSFGSYVAWRSAAQAGTRLLLTIAPPVHHYDYQEFEPVPSWFIIQGDDDDVVPLSLVQAFSEKFSPPLPITRFAGTGHFFHGKLLELKEAIAAIIRQAGFSQ
ncbi:alpha/beta hydrolase [Legionella dresdenensis]|uniref:Alpha/beta hydrolase n=1 Tax=Legionella dresdenensis TaxID=450200 RepID=A0ABV8CEW8_9GAMM